MFNKISVSRLATIRIFQSHMINILSLSISDICLQGHGIFKITQRKRITFNRQMKSYSYKSILPQPPIFINGGIARRKKGGGYLAYCQTFLQQSVGNFSPLRLRHCDKWLLPLSGGTSLALAPQCSFISAKDLLAIRSTKSDFQQGY